jgi:hypothetical protein
MPEKKKAQKKSTKQPKPKTENVNEELPENQYGGLPDVDLKKFLGCGG